MQIVSFARKMSASQILFMFLTVYCTAEAGLGLVAPREGWPNLGNALHFGPHLPRSHVDQRPRLSFLSRFNLTFSFGPKRPMLILRYFVAESLMNEWPAGVCLFGLLFLYLII